MLDHLKQRIEKALQGTEGAVLSTTGSSGLQTGYFPCEYHHELLYLLVPATIDLVVNLTQPVEVFVTSPGWQVWGEARALSRQAAPPELGLLDRENSHWNTVIEVQPIRIQLQPGPGVLAGETIDFDLERTEK